MSARLPDVIGIGTRRCGTSWLHAVLNSHADIGKPPSGLHYFSEHRDQDAQWYAQQLAPFADRSLLVEFSVSYLYPEYCADAAARMRALVPDVKLFVCLRNPLARAYSDYLRSVRMDEIPADMDFEQAIAVHPVLIDRSRYARLLKPYLAVFPATRLKVLFYEDLARDPQAFAAELADFLGVGAGFSEAAVMHAEPRGKTVRSAWLNRIIIGLKGAVDTVADGLGQGDRWSNWKGRHVGVYEKALDLTHREQALSEEVAARVAALFSEDVVFVERLTGKDLRGWYGTEE